MQIMDCLREATRPQHERLHEVVDLDWMTFTRDNYAHCLLAYLRAVAPVESSLEASSVMLPATIPCYPHRQHRLRKTKWLRKDLDVLETDPQPIPHELARGFLPSSCVAEFVGRSYVLEGMTLGATRIAPQIHTALGLDAATGARFFQAYGNRTGEMWRSFRNWAGSLEIESDVAVQQAQVTFTHFEHCLAAAADTAF